LSRGVVARGVCVDMIGGGIKGGKVKEKRMATKVSGKIKEGSGFIFRRMREGARRGAGGGAKGSQPRIGN